MLRGVESIGDEQALEDWAERPGEEADAVAQDSLHPTGRGWGTGGHSRVAGAWQGQQVGPASWCHCWSNYKTQVSGKKRLPGWGHSGAQSSLLKTPVSSCVEAAAVAQEHV